MAYGKFQFNRFPNLDFKNKLEIVNTFLTFIYFTHRKAVALKHIKKLQMVENSIEIIQYRTFLHEVEVFGFFFFFFFLVDVHY